MTRKFLFQTPSNKVALVKYFEFANYCMFKRLLAAELDKGETDGGPNEFTKTDKEGNKNSTT